MPVFLSFWISFSNIFTNTHKSLLNVIKSLVFSFVCARYPSAAHHHRAITSKMNFSLVQLLLLRLFLLTHGHIVFAFFPHWKWLLSRPHNCRCYIFSEKKREFERSLLFAIVRRCCKIMKLIEF
jgi:hypothetical protein